MTTVLVVDRWGDLASSLREELHKAWGTCEVVTATSDAQAMVLLQQRPVDKVLARSRPNDRSLEDFLSHLFTLNPGLEISIVAGSGDADEQAEQADQVLRNSPPAGGIDLLGIIRILHAIGRDTTLRVIAQEGNGALGFSEGRLVHAQADPLQGRDAFLQMALWQDVRLVELAQTGSGLAPGIDEPVPALLHEADIIRSVLRSEDDVLEQPSVVTDNGTIQGWWHQMRARRSQGVRVLVGYHRDRHAPCPAATAHALAEVLHAAKLSCTSPGDGPSFVRIHPAGGGLLSLSFVPMLRKNLFSFETFARSVDLAVICGGGIAAEAHEPWLACLPRQVPHILDSSNDSPQHVVLHALQWLAGETR